MNNELKDKIVEEYSRLIHGQREDIMRAFLAKYGFEAEDRVVQFNAGNKWGVVKIEPEEYAKVREEVIKSTAAREVMELVRAMIEEMRYNQGDQHANPQWECSAVSDPNGLEPALQRLAARMGYVYAEGRYQKAEAPRIMR